MNIDTTIEQVEKLYRSATGRELPALSDKAHAPFPPETDPKRLIEEQMDRLMTTLEAFSRGAPHPSRPWVPPLSVWEEEGDLVYCLDIPGVRRERVQVQLEGGAVLVSGSRQKPPVKKGSRAVQRWGEAQIGEFHRAILLPGGVKTEDIQAKVEDGVLELRMPRRVQPPAGKAVEVR